MELKGKVALVTGAARRVGASIARALAAKRMDVAVHYGSSASEARQVVNDLRNLGVAAEAFHANLREVEAARTLAGKVVEHFGRLDVVVNSAANMIEGAVESVTPEVWDEVMGLNLRSPFFVTQGAIPALRAAKGKVVNIADLAGLEPWPKYVAHCTSKAGVVMLTKALARALAPDITVNAVAPGAVLLPDDWDDAARRHFADTTPLKRLGSAEDVAQAVVYLLEADYVTGEVLVVDGGRLLR
ncbi:MAG TPA: SDR family oxidoreductase [Gemmatimonadales bacterium]|nr:SDR family oxidoreductase [Gemmatimonadales bacterium]